MIEPTKRATRLVCVFLCLISLSSNSISQSCTNTETFTSSILGADGSNYGISSAFSGDRYVVGGPGRYGLEIGTGGVTVHSWNGIAWSQISLFAADGMNADNYGTSVDIDGDRIVVGAYNKCYVYDWNGSFWDETKLTSTGSNNAFGWDIAVQGDRIVVGSPQDDTQASNAGSVSIFDWDGSSWIETIIFPSDSGISDFFGDKVDVDGDRIVVGSYSDDDAIFDGGSAYVYEWDGLIWGETKIYASDAFQYDYFGRSVSIDGDRIAIGAPGNNDPVVESGNAYIFDYDGMNWIETHKINTSPSLSENVFGTDLTLENDRLVIGAPQTNGGGHCYVFEFNGTLWNEIFELDASDGTSYTNFGRSVGLSGDRIIIGDPNNDEYGQNAGKAYLFEFDGTNWNETIDVPIGFQPANYYGTSVSKDGDRILVGASGTYFTGHTYGNGSVYLYEFDGANWNETIFVASDGAWQDKYGFDVSISGDRFAVLSQQDDDGSNNAGSIYIYDWDGMTWTETKIVASNASSGGGFASDLDLDGDNLIVNGSGYVYLYEWDGSTWIETQIYNSDFATNGGMGTKVSIDGDIFVASAPARINAQGAVYIFEHDGTSWNESLIVVPTAPIDGHRMGESLDLSGSKFIAGGSQFSNKAWIFDYDGVSGILHEVLPTGTANSLNNVALDGDRALIYSPYFFPTQGTALHSFEWTGVCWLELDHYGTPNSVSNDGFGYAFAIDGDSFVATNHTVYGMAYLYECSAVDPYLPVMVCQDVTINLDNNGTYSLTPTEIDNGSYVECGGGLTLTIDQVDFYCNDIITSPIIVTLLATDMQGNSNSCSALVTVRDIEAPILTCQDITVQIGSGSSNTIDVNDVFISATDNCGSVSNLLLDQTTIDCNSFQGFVTVSIEDDSGNIGYCYPNVTIDDMSPPYVGCQNVTISLNEVGEANVSLQDLLEVSTIAYENFTPLQGADPSNCSSSNDFYDNTNNFMVLEASDPTNCGGSGANECLELAHIFQTQDLINGEFCFEYATTSLGVGDVFGYTVGVDWNGLPATAANIQANVIPLKSSSDLPTSGAENLCLTANNQYIALIVYSDYYSNGAGETFNFNGDLANGIDPTSDWDLVNNCVLQQYTGDNVNPGPGQTPYDEFSFTTSCNNEYTIEIISSWTDAQAYLYDAPLDPQDICANIVAYDGDSGPNFDPILSFLAEENQTYYLDVSCWTPVTGTYDIVIQNGSYGAGAMNIQIFNFTLTSVTANDNCGFNVVASQSSFSCVDIGTNTILLTATDDFGNTSTCESVITVLDSHGPDLPVCYDLTLNLDETGEVNLTTQDLMGVGSIPLDGFAGLGSATINCSNTIAYYQDQDYMVLEASDPLSFGGGGANDCSFFSTGYQVVLPADGEYCFEWETIVSGAGDRFGYTLGNNDWLVTSPNIPALNAAVIQLADSANPGGPGATQVCFTGIQGQIFALIVYTDYFGNGNSFVSGALTVGIKIGENITDNCGAPNIILDKSQFFCNETGDHLVHLTVSDNSGNSESCSATVTILDILPPVVACQDITVNVDPDGSITSISEDATVFFIEDNCQVNTIETDITDFTIADVGILQVILSVTDISGNTTTCQSNVTVQCTCDPVNSALIPNTATGSHVAACKNDDGQFTHYCDSAGRLLLSIDSPTAATILPSEVSINITPGGFYYEELCNNSGGTEEGSCFITNEDGAVVLCRTWDVNNSVLDANIRFYFDDNDVDIINGELYNQGFDPLVNLEQMWFYKVNTGDGHAKPLDLAAADVTIIHNDGSGIPGYSNWSIGNIPSAYYAEYQVASFSGGGGGGSQGGSSAVCPLIEASLSGDEVFSTAGTGDVYIDIVGGTGPYTLALSNGTTVINYVSGDPISVSFMETSSYSIMSLSDANLCPAIKSGIATKFVSTGDMNPPLANCQDLVVTLDVNGMATITSSEVDNGSTDDEGIALMVLNQYLIDCNSSAMINLTVYDMSGNQSSCSSTLTINDPHFACCPASRYVPHTPNQFKKYQASQSVQSDAILEVGSGDTEIIMKAGNQVILGTGFEVEGGVKFESFIGPCDSN